MRNCGRATGLVLLLSAAASTRAFALDENEAIGRATIAVSDAEVGVTEVVAARHASRPPTPEERISAGDMFIRNKDYPHAVTMFNQVVELYRQKKASKSAHANALFLLGESYFRSDQLMAARRQFRTLAELSASSEYQEYAGRSLSRLVDVALRTDGLTDLDFVFEQMNRLAQDDASGSLAYARGKAYFAKRDYPRASRALLGVAKGSPFSHQAGYLLGVIYTNQALGEAPVAVDPQEAEKVPSISKRFARAVLQFQRVVQMKADSTEHQHVIDLAWMALGRLFYETDNYGDAADAYGHVDRRSPEFATMLFELGWVYVRQGDFKQAERALEVLSVVSPESLHFADGSLLRADLMLRSKQFDGALRVYQSVRGRFNPVHTEVDAFLKKTSDPAVYYDRLVEDRLGVETQSELSPVVMEWVREQSEDDRVFALIDDVTLSRDLIRKSRELAKKLSGVLASSTRAKAFPDIKLRLQSALGFTNQIALAKRDLARGLESADDSAWSGELGRVRAERRQLMKRLDRLPVTPGDFVRRENSGRRQWDKLSQRLQQLTLEADKLQAVVNGLKRILRDADRFGVVADSAQRATLATEIEANERDLTVYRKRIQRYRDAIERGRVQIGFGDKRYVDDKAARARFEQLFEKELQLVASGQGGGAAAEYARRALPVVARANAAQRKLKMLSTGYEREVKDRSQDLALVVGAEAAKMEAYADQIDVLDQHARLLVGEVAMRNFGLVRERLKSVVLRADVGVVQQAWEVRESHRERMQSLQRERATEEQYLNDELKEVLHDGGGEL